MDKHTSKFQILRNKAEELLVENKYHSPIIKTELDALIHELEVYQIELEMQNEELIRTQIKLEESRDDYIQLYDFAPVGYFTLDQNWIIKRVNLKGSVFLGVPRKYLIDSAFLRFIKPDYREKFYELCKNVRKTNLNYNCEVELVSDDINPFFAHLDTIEMVDDEGNFKEFMITVTDISEIKKTELKLKEISKNLEKLVEERTEELELSNVYNRRLIETSLDPLVTIGPDGMITDVNRATEVITGYSRNEIVGSDFSNYFTNPREAKKGYKLVFEEGKVRDYPLEIINKNGNITPVMYNAAVYKDEFNEVIGVFAAARDITEIKNAEKELRQYWKSLEEQVELRTEELAKRTEELSNSNADLKQFAYVASHDLREPLRMITSFLQLLEQRYKDHLDQDAIEFIGFAVNGARRLDKMIMDLLEYSSVANKEMMFEDVDLEEVLYHVNTNLKVLIDENKATITFDSLPTVKGDAYQMILLFQNLISNSIKYRREDAPKINIIADKEADRYVFSVKDNGMGIDSNYLEGIFNIFKRLHTHEEYEGTGIGLAIAQRIVHQHDGKIWAESELGEGTTFYFILPVP
ncbi:PAS domain S-box protein [Methanobacterium sp. CWC-01]|uniref:PAS domain-containing sensor histidine kinase n=1 Tax=Methanobacterium aridiramus TaxID=2584467 RepID=UPI0025789F8D|nr:PAS domain S-box protein [Methanobacterium sp. CWC-01]WJI09423.1 PAS domain S-box protein [Methanobacterium sp. CWC-01]